MCILCTTFLRISPTGFVRGASLSRTHSLPFTHALVCVRYGEGGVCALTSPSSLQRSTGVYLSIITTGRSGRWLGVGSNSVHGVAASRIKPSHTIAIDRTAKEVQPGLPRVAGAVDVELTKLNVKAPEEQFELAKTKNLSLGEQQRTHSLKPCRKGYGMPMVLTQRACTDHTDRTDRTDRTNTSILFLEQNHFESSNSAYCI